MRSSRTGERIIGIHRGMRRLLHASLRVLAVVWASPTTLIGLLFLSVGVATGGRAARVRGVLEAHGGWLRWALTRLPVGRGGAAAVTLGHVVLATSAAALAATRTHERAHVAQCERWGPLFLPAYAIASLSALARGADAYRGNRFEREAIAAESDDAARRADTWAHAGPDPTPETAERRTS